MISPTIPQHPWLSLAPYTGQNRQFKFILKTSVELRLGLDFQAISVASAVYIR